MGSKADNISYAALFLGLGTLFLLRDIWPNLLLVLAIFFMLKHGLNRSYLRMLCLGLICIGTYICVLYPQVFSWGLILPFILFILGIERLFKEFFKGNKVSKKKN